MVNIHFDRAVENGEPFEMQYRILLPDGETRRVSSYARVEQFRGKPVRVIGAIIDAVGCDGNAFWYTFALTVTDPLGLATAREVSLYPDCASIQPIICGNLDANATRSISDVARLRSALARPFTTGLTPGELSRCSVIGGAECDVVDLTVLRRYLVGRAPSPQPVCPAAQP